MTGLVAFTVLVALVGLERVAELVVSTRMRTTSRAALRIVKTTAVIQAACTSGRATPSTTTAT